MRSVIQPAGWAAVLEHLFCVQIATRGTVYVFHLKRIGKSSQTSDSKYPVQDFIHAANIVRPLLESASIRAPQGTPEARMLYKCGIGIKDDLDMLKEFGPKLQPKCGFHPIPAYVLYSMTTGSSQCS